MNHNEITLTEDEAVLYDYSKVITYCKKHRKKGCKNCVFRDRDFYCIINALPIASERRLINNEILQSEKD